MGHFPLVRFLSLLMLILSVQPTWAQTDWFECDTVGVTVSSCVDAVPSMYVDMRNSVTQKWYSCKISRGPKDSLCCGVAVGGNDQCIEFKVRVDQDIDAIVLEIPESNEPEWQNDQNSYSGPNPVPSSPGAKPSINTYRIKTSSGACMGPYGGAQGDQPACLSGSILNDTIFLLFCQTGNNANVYRIKTLKAEINPDIMVLAEGCGSTVSVSAKDINVSSVTWNSTQNPAYNAYLSSTMGDTTVTVTVPKGAPLPPGTPPVLVYQVCADPLASGVAGCGVLPQVCATVQVTVVSPPSATVDAPTVCPGDPYYAEVTGQGSTTLNYTWFDGHNAPGSGTSTGTTDNYTFASPGDKSVVIVDPSIVALGFGVCAYDTVNFTISTYPLPNAVISGPPLICINTEYGFSTPNVPGASYAWQFREYPGNSLISTSSSRTPTRNFSTCGDKLAILTVTSMEGCDSTVMRVFQADSIPPDLSSCNLPDPTVECGGTAQNDANILAWHNANLAILQNASGCVTDDCPWIVTSDFDPDNYTPDPNCGNGTTAGSIRVIYTVSDGCQEDTISAIYTIEDTALPTVNDPNLDDITVQCVLEIPPVDTNFMASDVCGNVSREWVSDVGGGNPCNLQIVRTYRVTDACGNIALFDQTFTVNDNMNPSITCPSDVLIEACDVDTLATHSLVANLEFSPSIRDLTLLELQAAGGDADDNCGIDSLYYYDAQAGSCPIVVTRTFVVVDSCGNRVQCQQQIDIDDTTLPLINCPAQVLLEGCDVGILSSAPEVGGLGYSESNQVILLVQLTNLGGGASDNCSIASIYYYDTQSGSCPIVITRTFVVVDGCGNEEQCTQEIQIDDTTAPTISCPANIILEECDVGDLANAPLVGNLEYSETNHTIDITDLTGLGGAASDLCGIEQLYYFDSQTGSCPIIVTRTFVAIDTCGNDSSCSYEIRIDDTTLPMLTCPAPQDLEACGVYDLENIAQVGFLEYSESINHITVTELNGAGGNASDNCGIDSLYFFDSQTGSCPITITRTFVVVDSCHNRVQCTQTITIDDTTLPLLTCPSDVVLEACGVDDLASIPQVASLEYSETIRSITVADIQLTGGDASDNCGIDSLYYVDSRIGSCPIILIRRFTVVDSCGNRVSCDQEIQIDDTTDPVLICPADDVVEACNINDLATSAQVGNLEYSETPRSISVSDIQALGGDASDNCSIDSLYYFDVRTGRCPIIVTRTYVVVDSCGNRVSCPQAIQIDDTTDPVLQCPGDQTVEACGVGDLQNAAEVNNFEYSESVRFLTVTELQGLGGDASDNCAIDSLYYIDVQNGSCPIVVTRTFVVVDTCGNRVHCAQTIEIDDTTDPTITCPANEVIEACGVGDLGSSAQVGSLEYSETVRSIQLSDLVGLGGLAADNCGIDSLYYYDIQTGSCPIVVTRTYVVVDSCSNSISCPQEIQINDTTLPEITCPGDEIIEACGVSDLESAVEVGGLEYSEAIRFISVADIQALNGTASDNCGIDSLYYFDTQIGFCPIVVTRTFVVVDSCGNRVDCPQEIQINDTTDPILVCPADDVVEGCSTADLALSAQVGNLEYSEAFRLITVAEMQATGGNASDNCGIDSLYYYDVKSGSCPIVITRTFVVVDSCGNTIDCQQEIQINDTTDPTITCPPDAVIEGCDASALQSSGTVGNLAYSEDIALITIADLNGISGDAGDNCFVDSLYYFDSQAGSCPIVITRTFVVVDSCGNRVQCDQEIQIDDSTLPSLTCPPSVSIEACRLSDLATRLEVGNLGFSTVPVNITTGEISTAGGNASDNCGIDSLYYIDVQTGTCPITIERTFVVVDSCGNRVDCTTDIEIHDTTDPAITCPGNVVIEACNVGDLGSSIEVANLEYSETPRSIGLTDLMSLSGNASDNCGIDSLYYFDAQSGFCPIVITRTFVVKDSCGNTAFCPQEIQINDTTVPTITCPPNRTIEACTVDDLATSTEVGNLEYSETVRFLTLFEFQGRGGNADDNCGIDSLYYYDTNIDTCPILVSRTFVVVDSCGNRMQCVQEIQIDDTTIPSLTCPNDVTGEGCDVVDVVQISGLAYTDARTVIDEQIFNALDAQSAVSDICGIREVAYVDVIDQSSCPLVITRTFEAIDLCGNINICIQQITVEDTELPVITCPSDLTGEGCDVSVVETLSGLPFSPVTVILSEVQFQQLNVPGSVSDNCGIAEINYVDVIDQASCPLIITRTFTVIDSCGLLSVCPQEIVIQDTEDPVITCPSDISVEGCTTDELITLTGLEYSGVERSIDGQTFVGLDPVSAVDDNCGVLEVRYIDQIISPNCPIRIQRKFTVYDSCGLQASCTQLLELLPVALIDPVCPASMVVASCLAQSEVDALFTTWKAEFQYLGDGCNVQLTRLDTVDSPDACGGEKTIVFEVVDFCGNRTSCSATFTVPIAPILTMTCTPPINVQCEADVPQPFSSVSAFEAAGGSFANTCGIIDASFRLISEVSDDQSCPEIRVRTYEVRDVCGHIQTCTQQIRINDTIPPELTGVPGDRTVACTVVPQPPVIGVDIVATDNCVNPTIIFEEEITPGVCENIYGIVRTWTTRDDCGNEVQAVQNIMVTDCRPDVDISINPNPVCLNGDVTFNALITDNYNHPVYRWQFLWNGTWTDVSGGNVVPFTKQGVDIDDQGSYRLLIADAVSNIFNEDCNVVSETVELVVIEPVVTDLVASICEGDSYTVGTSTYETTGSYTDILQASSGCDSVVNLELTVLENSEFTLDTFICQGDRFIIGTSAWSQTGTYEKRLTNNAGCDSIITLHLTVHEPTIFNVVDTICEGAELMVGDETYDSTGHYTQVLTDRFGCDSIYNVDLTVHPILHTTINAEICFGQRYPVGNQSFSAPGTYTIDLISQVTGCDSMVTLNLVVTNEINVYLDRTICVGDSFQVGTVFYDTAGQYIDTLIAAAGCDSIVTLDLKLATTLMTSIDTVLCEGDAIQVGSQSYSATGHFVDTLISNGGCDSIVTLDLVVHPVYDTSIIANICHGSFFEAGGQTFNASGNYTLNLGTAFGCDSIVHLDLTVHSLYDTTYTVNLCAGDTFQLGSENYSTSGYYTQTFTSIAGCDSTIHLDITVSPAYDISLNEIVCEGGSVTVGSNTYDSTGIYVDSLKSEHGCDSVITLDLVVVAQIKEFQNVQICEGDNYTFGGIVYNSTGTYTETFTSSQGCDSVVTLDLQVLSQLRDTISEEMCEGGVYDFDGTMLTTGGSFNKTYTSQAGCDSVVTLELTVNPTLTTILFEELCDGEAFTLGVQNYDVAGTYQETLTSSLGCDSTVTLHLSFTPAAETNLDQTICAGESVEFAGQTLDSTGYYLDSLSTVDGCDSIVTLSLTVLDTSNIELSEQICLGQSYSFNGQLLTTSGTYTADLQTVGGCDSTVTVQLEVVDVLNTQLSDTICEGTSYQFFDQELTLTGTYSEQLISSTGCDSVVTLSLVIRELLTEESFVSICAGEIFLFGTDTLTTSGTYENTFTSTAGCDSISKVHLTVFQEHYDTTFAEICIGETYDFQGKVYNSSGSYVDTSQTSEGCNHYQVLELVVQAAASDTIAATICANETFDFNGQSLNVSGTYLETRGAANGCDSLTVLILEVRDVIQVQSTVEICIGQMYDFNGQILTAAGDYRETFVSVDGCDSIVDLTLLTVATINTDLEAFICSGDSVTIGNKAYFSAGTYQDTLTSSGGCDSIVHISITSASPKIEQVSVSICQGESYFFNGVDYSASIQISDTLVSSEGCDSIVQLDLTVIESYEEDKNITLCQGANYTYNGQDYSQSGTHDILLTSESGCDSIVHLHIQVVDEIVEQLEVQICTGSTYQFAGQTLSVGGTYVDSTTSTNGCDSIVTLQLQVLNTLESSESHTICAGDSVRIGNLYFSTDTLFSDTLASTQGCDSVISYQVVVLPSVNLVGYDTVICEGESVELGVQVLGSQSGSLSWSPAEGLSCTDCARPLASPTQTTTYVVSTPGCLDSLMQAEVTVQVRPIPDLVVSEDQSILLGESVTLSATTTNGIYTVDWYQGDELLCGDCPELVQQPTENSQYTVTAYDDFGCMSEDVVEVLISGDPCDIGLVQAPNAITPNDDGFNDNFQVINDGDAVITLIQIFNRWGQTVFETSSTEEVWDGTYLGEPLNPAVFMYMIHVDCAEIGTAILVGNVTLIR